MDEYIILSGDGSVTAVAEDVDIFEYAKDIGGTVVRRDEYSPPPHVPSSEELAIVESDWRVAETAIVKDNLEAILFEDSEALPGTEAEWKAYGVALRKWKEGNPDFPDFTRRPPRPA